MFGLIGDLLDGTARLVGTVAGIAIALGVSERMVRKAVEAGCKTQSEIKEWIEENS